MGLLTQANVAIDGSKFKAVNNRDKNFTRAKMERRMAQIEESVARYPEQLEHCRPAGAVRGAANQDEPPQREDRDAEAADAASRASQGGDACHPGPADIADRSRCTRSGVGQQRFYG